MNECSDAGLNAGMKDIFFYIAHIDKKSDIVFLLPLSHTTALEALSVSIDSRNDLWGPCFSVEHFLNQILVNVQGFFYTSVPESVKQITATVHTRK